MNSVYLIHLRTKNGKRCSGLEFENLESESVTSLVFSAFEPSVGFEQRSKAIPRGEGYV